MQHIITDDQDFGDGWTLYTEYKPVDEDAGVWGWYWVIEQECEDREDSLEERRLDDKNIALSRGFFGPFGTEIAAKESGISVCSRIKGNTKQWERLTGCESRTAGPL
jgi:hypothetical protein